MTQTRIAGHRRRLEEWLAFLTLRSTKFIVDLTVKNSERKDYACHSLF